MTPRLCAALALLAALASCQATSPPPIVITDPPAAETATMLPRSAPDVTHAAIDAATIHLQARRLDRATLPAMANPGLSAADAGTIHRAWLDAQLALNALDREGRHPSDEARARARLATENLARALDASAHGNE